MSIINLIKKANFLDSQGKYAEADKIDNLIKRLASGETHKDSSGVLWTNVGVPKDFGLIGAGNVWQRQDNMSKQVVPVGKFPDSSAKAMPAKSTQPAQTQQVVKKEEPVEQATTMDMLTSWTKPIVEALN